MRALAKLEHVLPPRLHRRVSALHAGTVTIPSPAADVQPSVLTELAAAVRDRERLRFAYERHDGGSGRRMTDPHRLVHTRGRWYLVGWDLNRDAWRIYRVDRIKLSSHTGPRFAPRPEPDDDIVAYVERRLGQATWRYRTRVKVHASADQVIARVPPAVIVEAVDERSCFANVGSDSAHELALWLGLIDADFEAGDDRELAQQLRGLADRYMRAAG